MIGQAAAPGRGTAPAARRIVILGAARSGTKALRDALALATGAGRVPYDIGYVWRHGNEHRPDDVLETAAVDQRARRFIRQFVDRYAAGEPPTVIEKTVGNSLRLPVVAAVFPDAALVHLIRDGVDVAESAYRQWTAPVGLRYLLAKLPHVPLRLAPRYGAKYLRSVIRRHLPGDRRLASWGPRYRGIDEDLRREELLVVCARQWRESVTRTREDADRLGLRLYEIRYERLVADPERELVGLISALGLSHSSDRLREAARRLTPNRQGVGRRRLDRRERALLEDEIGDLLDALRYQRPLGDTDGTPPERTQQGGAHPEAPTSATTGTTGDPGTGQPSGRPTASFR